MLKITRNPWEHNAYEQDFDKAVVQEIEDMPAHRLQSVIAGLRITLVEKDVMTPRAVIDLMGADWGFDE
jgi:hypothetical protein